MGGTPGRPCANSTSATFCCPRRSTRRSRASWPGQPGLIRLASGPAYDLWQVAGTVARARVIAPGGTAVPVPSGPVGVNTVLAASTSGTLVLAEAEGGWSATLNGKPLTPLARPVDGWAQGFVLPAGGGRLVIARDETARDLSLGAEAVAILVVVALALPGTRSAAAAAAAQAQAQAEPESESVPAAGRRRDRASGPKPARRTRPPRFAEPESAPAPTPAPAPAPAPAPPAATPKRPRGQHAARHGRPPRRGREPAAENLDLVPAEDDAGGPAQRSYDPMAAGYPRESGDRW